MTSFVHASPVLDIKRSIETSGCFQPKLTDNPPWSTVDEMEMYLPDDDRISYFWSGGVGKSQALTIAEKCAGEAGVNGATIGMAMCKAGTQFVMPSDAADKVSAEARQRWEDASQVFASYARNVAYTATGNSSVASVWFRVELPELRKNGEVNAIIQLSEDCGHLCHWYCSGSDNPDCKDLKPCLIETEAPSSVTNGSS
ncbi:hypothetical protein BYT27DRAFT_7248713 [Phlegmacium glaucopus]|nr:hypothetical protein BYT27DRAFT_7248713 [Phlegmacium glaucopus]